MHVPVYRACYQRAPGVRTAAYPVCISQYTECAYLGTSGTADSVDLRRSRAKRRTRLGTRPHCRQVPSYLPARSNHIQARTVSVQSLGSVRCPALTQRSEAAGVGSTCPYTPAGREVETWFRNSELYQALARVNPKSETRKPQTPHPRPGQSAPMVCPFRRQD